MSSKKPIKFAINRLDFTSPMAFAESAARAESLGWHMALIPCNPLSLQDPYVNLAFAAQATKTLNLGTLLDTPILRHPSVIAGSIATVAQLAPNRVHLGLGIGDTAVRFNGLSPATVKTLEAGTRATKAFLAGESLQVGAARPAQLRHPAKVPVWLAAQGPKTLRMAGALADGVWIRVGRHPDNLMRAWEEVCEGAQEAGRDPENIELGLIFHTTFSKDRNQAKTIAKSLAAGYYEYSPFLFDAPGLEWTGLDVEELKKQAWPDFHHHRDMEKAGRLVDFLDDAAADAFALYGDWSDIAEQLNAVLALDLPVSIVLPHPVLPQGSAIDYLQQCAQELIPTFT
jgi:5,10-methylenetetrahydromethanopterin reductase